MTASIISKLPFFAHNMTQRQKLTLRLIAVTSLLVICSASYAIVRQVGQNGQTDEAPVLPTEASPSSLQQGVSATKSESLFVDAVRLDQLQPTTIPQHYAGIVMARQTSRLAATVLGRVEQIHVQMGDRVDQGQVLVELDARDLIAERSAVQAQLASSRAKLREMQHGPRKQEIQQAQASVNELEASLRLRRMTLNRNDELQKSSSISAQEIDESRSALDVAAAKLDAARYSLDLLQEGTRSEQIEAQLAAVEALEAQILKLSILIGDQKIVAPFDGHVQTRFIDPGVVVSPGQAILEVAETDRLEVHVGLPAEVTSPRWLSTIRIISQGQTLKAQLSRLSPTIDQRTRNVEVIFSVDHLAPFASEPGTLSLVSQEVETASTVAQLPVRIGQAVDVEVAQPSSGEGWWVPSTALTPGIRGLWTILLVVPLTEHQTDADTLNCIVQTRQVELLRTAGDWSQLQGALNNSDLLIRSGQHRITAGQQVCVSKDVLVSR